MSSLAPLKSSRKIGINSLSVLSHHRAYRSVHGGSLLLYRNDVFDVVFSYPNDAITLTYLSDSVLFLWQGASNTSI
ncbi:hypothetical protein [Olivibacter sitiensis]|uniref:hypothetical protein n=1 Tax=Olivibacter sitiensis TaxID=376470 RepID=UPI0012F749D1|nr:hypothetical protein [Olivibacter sitiensis]